MIDWQVGDVIRIKRAFDFDAMGTDLNVKITIGEGQTFAVTEVAGDNLVVEMKVGGRFDATITTTWHISLIDEEAIELLRPLEEEPEEPEQPEQPKPPTGEEPMEYQRYSKATIKATTKRPEVFLYQGALKAVGAYDGEVDGWFGNGSAEAVKAFQEKNNLEPVDGVIGKGTASVLLPQAHAAGFVPDLNTRIMSVIAFYEVSNRRDAFGMAENDIGDGAGANYGIFQCNSYGSVVSMLKLAGRSDLVNVYNGADKKVVNPTIQDWFGSTEGIKTQMRYFEEKLLKLAMKELRAFGAFDAWEDDPSMKKYWERAVLLFCDSVVQNGTMWSGSRKPFWKGIEDWEKSDPKGYKWPELYYGTWWNETLGKYIDYGEDGESGMKALWWKHYEKHGGKDRSDLDKGACKAANQSAAQEIVTQHCAADPEAQLLVVAQFRSRSSWDKYWYQAVASRRITDAAGTSAAHPSGVVNGAKLKLAEDYAI